MSEAPSKTRRNHWAAVIYILPGIVFTSATFLAAKLSRDSTIGEYVVFWLGAAAVCASACVYLAVRATRSIKPAVSRLLSSLGVFVGLIVVNAVLACVCREVLSNHLVTTEP